MESSTYNVVLPDQLAGASLAGISGSVIETTGSVAAVAGFPAPVGALVAIETSSGNSIDGEVVGFREESTLVVPLERAAVARFAGADFLRFAGVRAAVFFFARFFFVFFAISVPFGI